MLLKSFGKHDPMCSLKRRRELAITAFHHNDSHVLTPMKTKRIGTRNLGLNRKSIHDMKDDSMNHRFVILRTDGVEDCKRRLTLQPFPNLIASLMVKLLFRYCLYPKAAVN